MTNFKREERYVVFKLSHLDGEQIDSLDELRRQCPTVDCVVVEDDWPEYSVVWKMIEERVKESK